MRDTTLFFLFLPPTTHLPLLASQPQPPRERPTRKNQGGCIRRKWLLSPPPLDFGLALVSIFRSSFRSSVGFSVRSSFPFQYLRPYRWVTFLLSKRGQIQRRRWQTTRFGESTPAVACCYLFIFNQSHLHPLSSLGCLLIAFASSSFFFPPSSCSSIASASVHTSTSKGFLL